MATFQIMYWHDIPAQIKVKDEHGTVKKMLPDRFQQAIDSAAMGRGKTDADAYLDGWRWSRRETRDGSAQDVADALAEELDQSYPQTRLREMILAHARNKD